MSRAQQSFVQGSTKMPSSKSTGDKVKSNDSAKPFGGRAKSDDSQQIRSNKKSRTRGKKRYHTRECRKQPAD